VEDQYLLEEYKLIKSRIESNEHRRHQILVLCLTGAATALGLGDKIQSGLAPFLVGGLVLMSSAVNTIYMSLQAFATAFLAERVETRFGRLGFETTYASVAHRENDSVWDRLKSRPLGFVSDPFVILWLFSIAVSIVFGWSFVIKATIGNASVVLYILGLVFLHVLILDTLVERRRRRLRWFRERLQPRSVGTEATEVRASD
jgi:hypothetical protein